MFSDGEILPAAPEAGRFVPRGDIAAHGAGSAAELFPTPAAQVLAVGDALQLRDGGREAEREELREEAVSEEWPSGEQSCGDETLLCG